MLQIRQLEKRLDGHCALSIDALDLEVGEIVAVIGPADGGRSLLLNILAGVVAPSRGNLTLGGRPLAAGAAIASGSSLTGAATTRGHVGVLFAEDLLYERLGAQENLAFFCRWRGLPVSEAELALKRIGLSDQAHSAARKLTPSERRRLAFGRALLGQPRLLLLDQPPLRADMETQDLFMQVIRSTAAEGALVMVMDEDLAWAGKCCTQVIELQGGHVVSRSAISPSRDDNGTALSERFTPFKVPARKEDRILLYDPGDILYATSRNGKTYLRTAGDEAQTTLTLGELESRLVGRGFFKAHRAYLVNLQHVKAVIQYTRNSYTLQLDDEQETTIPLSRQSERALHDLLGY